MGLFKAKTKEVDYETEATLPTFSVDPNGFIMFDNPSLGGAAIMEVTPWFATESITHIDSVYQEEATDFVANPGYEPSCGVLFPDARKRTFAPWSYFLNSLMPSGPGDEPTYIQILLKKGHPDFHDPRGVLWKTQIDYAWNNCRRDFNKVLRERKTTRNPHTAIIASRTADYAGLIGSLRKQIQEEEQSQTFYIRAMQSYQIKYYLIVSYTPSGEGWWMDGRDSDYYITDNRMADLLFGENEDKGADRLMKIRSIFKKTDPNAGYDVGGQASDFFWIESDRTAQVINTRIDKIKHTIAKWNRDHPDELMPFDMRMLDAREAAALICFFPNVLTRYWDKIWDLDSNQNDVLYTEDYKLAIITDDRSFTRQKNLAQDIADERVDMRHTKTQQDDFLSQYRGKDFGQINDLGSERDQLFWTPEEEERRNEMEREKDQLRQQSMDLWGHVDEHYTLNDEYATPEQRREDFLSKYRNRAAPTDNNLQ